MNNLPHKPEPETKEDRKWHNGEWNPNLCKICEKRVNHPIHAEKYRNRPDLYKQEHPNKL